MDTHESEPLVPHRHGNYTNFMDASARVAKARERGMVANGDLPLNSVVAPYIPETRDCTKPYKLRFLASDLDSNDSAVRCQALMAFNAKSCQYSY